MTLAQNSAVGLFDQQHIALDDVSWDFYEHVLEQIGDRPIRVTFSEWSIRCFASSNSGCVIHSK